MEMGNRPDELVFHAARKKLMRGPSGLLDVNRPLFDLLAARHPEHLEPPKTFESGTISQWNAFPEWQRSRESSR